ncbi:T9SS type B sorting domain-containing protein [Mangrovimonas spongiae]|uniref:Chromophore lyase n=1 Tax=Mangrovimonas spongiae TaxID=2494697 RepID=A0A428JWU3_9FLAO|nr:T9SS type B sorting domain-containing protein [Mangrovimonas spongiae]RSK38526.1 chromophore lyase [Mangrovimonas spongiae]
MKTSTYLKSVLLILFMFTQYLNSIAQTFEPFSIRENIETKGSMLVIGNNILGIDNQPLYDNSIDNQDVSMQYIDIDSDASTFSSSSADLVLSPHEDGSATTCYRVAYAALYWGAFLQDGSRSDINQVKFKTPESSTYTDITGEVIYDAIVNPILSEEGEPGNTPYACYADVTDILNGLNDIEGTYTMANVTSSEGTNFSTGLAAGWTLFVIYEDPELHTKSFTTFDGFSHIYDDHYEEIPVTGFTTPPAGHIDLQFAYAALDGDKNNRATKLEINGKEVTTPLRPANSFFGAVIENTNGVTHPRDPFGTNTLGYDTGFLEIFNSEPEYIGNNETSASFTLQVARGQADPIFSFFSAFAVDVISPEVPLTKIVTDENGVEINGDDVYLGQNLFYEISYQNTGNEDVTNFTITDVLPDNIVFDPATDIDLSNSGGATLLSYDPITRTLVFSIPDESVEVDDPEFVIRLAVQVVPNCYDLSQACSNEIINQAFGSYTGVNSGIVIDEQASYNSDECFIDPQPTNFLVDISDCNFEREEVLCGDSVILTASDGYDSYSWSTSPTGTPVIGTGQTFTATELGTYYVTNTAPATCLSIQEVITVVLYGETQTNPVIPYADEVVTCPNDGKLLPNIFLCGANDTRDILTGISDAVSIIWEQLDESSCPAVSDPDCANENDACTWNQVGSGPDYTANTAGQFRLIINYPGGCYSIFYFNVYQNLLDPTAVAQDIICDTPGQITVNNVPSGYEYSIDGVNYQASNIFTVTSPGYYIIYIRQIGVDTNPCIFETPSVYVRARDFSVTTSITQPECYGDMGGVHMAVNDALPQYYFSVYQNGTLVDSVGPTMSSDYDFNSLNAGTYTITASTDDGCLYTEDIEIIEPPLLTVTAALTTPLTCTDGEITVYPEGGTPPYVYEINGTDFQTTPVITVETPGVYNIIVQDSNNCTAETTITVEIVPEPDFTVAQTNIACAGNDNGSITINVTNANGNTLEYSIDGGATFTNSPVFTNLPEGTYQVVVQYSIGTSVCETTPQPITITAAPPLNGTAELSAPYTCTNTGTISVTGVTGGTPPYSYSIDGVNFQTGNTFTGLSAGTYTITIQDASGCTFIANTIVIDALDPPSDLTFNHTPLSCPSNVSTITITGVTGGTGVIEYQIIAPASAATPYQTSNTFSNLPPGTYTFQVRDENDCTYSETYTIDPLPELNLNTILDSDLDCTATSEAVISGTISGGTAPYSYAVSINGGAYTTLGATGNTFTYTTSTAGTYQFQITDANNCTIDSIIHTVEPITPPALSLVTQGEPILCHGDSNASIDITIDTSVGTPPFTINVYNDTTGTDYGTQTSGLPAGNYTVTVTDAKSCTATDTITITEPDDINVNYHTVDITCTASGVSQGSIIIDNVTGGTAPYNYYVTGTNGYSNSEFNASGTTSVSFDVVDFGLYEINVVDANGCSVLIQNVLVASPPTDLDIYIETSVDCTTGGEAVVSIGSSLSSSGPFYFSIYQGPISVYPDPAGSWIPEDSPGSESATFTGLTPGVSYTFIVYDTSTNCSYYEPATAPIPTNSTLTATAVSESNITCTGSADGSVSFNINSIYGSSVDVHYEIFDSLSQNSTGISDNGTVPANGTLTVTDLGPLPFGNYYVLIEETSGPNAGCSIATIPFNITESANPLSLTVSIDQNANCNPNSGIISAIGHDGTAPYQYQITTTAAAPSETDPAWASTNVFNVDGGDYYVHVMDAYGCIVSSPVTTVPTDPSPIIDAIVNNQCTVNEGEFVIDVSMPTAGMPPYSFSINGGAFQTQTVPFSITNLSSGTHTIEVNDVNGCGNLVTVTIEPPLDITPELTTEPSCNNDDGEITITGIGGSGNYSYSISPNPTSISLTGNVFSGVPSGIYTVTITDVNTSCTAEATISLPEATQPTITTTPTAVTCFGDNSGTFELLVNGYSGAYTYEVFDDIGISVLGPIATNTSTNPETVSGLASGNYTVTITETEVPFCSATSNVIINSPTQALTLTVLETSNVTCNNDSGTITATATGGWGNYEYELTGDTTVAYSPNGTFTGLSAGNYTVNVRDDSNCIASESITLVEPTPINATFTPSTNMLACFGDQNASITITNVTGGQGSNYTYTLNTILPTPSTSGPQTSNVFDNLGAGTYTITIEDGYSCEMTSANIVIDQPTPVDVNLVTQSTQTCLNDATLTLSASGGTAPYTYSNDASFTNVLGSFNSSVTFTVSEGTHSFYVQDANGCATNVSNEITVDPLQPLVINLDSTNPTINCAGDNTGSIIASAEGGLGNYVYELQDSSGNTINATQNTPGVFTNLIAGTYMVYVESDDCTETTALITITEPDTSLDATFTVSDVTCYGSNNGMLEINATGGTGTIMYAISPQMDQFFETNVFENLAPGTYDVIVQDELGCYIMHSFTVNEPTPVMLSIVPNSIFPEVCEGDLDGEFSITISGGSLPYSVSLDSYDGPYSTGDATQTQFDFTGLSGGDHIVFVRDAEGCESEWNITMPESVTINPTVIVEYGCVDNISGNTVTVMVDESIDTSLVDYSLNGGPYQTSNIFTNLPAGQNHYVDVRHTNGCIQSTEFFSIETYDPLTLTLTEGELNEIIATANGGTGDYEFTFNGDNYGSTNTFIITYSGTHTVTVTDTNGCTAVATIDMEFVDVCVPNYFTPNGDGVLDQWGPGCALAYPNLEFSIFDRYGRKVATLRIGEKWDGRYKGNELPTGDYWYVVNLNSSDVDKNIVGHFTLYR